MLKADLDLDDFNAAFENYKRASKRSMAEIINAKIFFIARHATQTTDKASVMDVDRSLLEAARTRKNRTVADMIVIRDNYKKGEKFLSPSKIKTLANKLIRARRRSVGFLRSGWLPAIRTIQAAVNRGDISFSSKYKPKIDNKVKTSGTGKGYGKPANPNTDRCFGEIANLLEGSPDSTTKTQMHQKIINGLQKALRLETQSMKKYIEDKLNSIRDKHLK